MLLTTPMQNKSKSDRQGWSVARPSVRLSMPCVRRLAWLPGMHRPFIANRANPKTRLLSLSGGSSG